MGAANGNDDPSGPYSSEYIRSIQAMAMEVSGFSEQVLASMQSAHATLITPLLAVQKFLEDQAYPVPNESLLALSGGLQAAVAGLPPMADLTGPLGLFSDVLSAASISIPVPDFSYLAALGSLASSGALNAQFLEAARTAVEGTEGLPEAINDFSLSSLRSELFDLQTIREGTYILVFATWLAVMLVMGGQPGLAEGLADFIGLGGIAGSHVVAKSSAKQVEKLVTRRQSGGYQVDEEDSDERESGPNQA